jgi:hypothetical protein
MKAKWEISGIRMRKVWSGILGSVPRNVKRHIRHELLKRGRGRKRSGYDIKLRCTEDEMNHKNEGPQGPALDLNCSSGVEVL